MDGNIRTDRSSFSSVINGVRRVVRVRQNVKPGKYKGTDKMPKSLKGSKTSSLRSVSFESVIDEEQLPGYGNVNNPNLIGVVMPMGHGKTHSWKEGWLDVDNLLTHEMREKMIKQIAEDMMGGATYDESFLKFLPHISAVLQIMGIEDRTLVMCNSHAMLKALGIPISGTLILESNAFEENISQRSEWEKNLARANRSVASIGYRNEHVMMVDDNEEMHAILYRMCEIMHIPVALPNLYFDTDYQDPATGAGDGLVDIEDVYQRYREGEVSRQTLFYQIKSLGLETYKYMGKDYNDWAKCGAKVVHSRGKIVGMPGYESWPVQVKKLIKNRVVQPSEQVDAIVKAHDGEPERFLCTLLVHWEISGKECDADVLPLYLVRLSAWRSVQGMVGELARCSGTLFGKVLVGEARGIVTNMTELGLCMRSSLRSHRLVSDRTTVSKHMVRSQHVKKAHNAFKRCKTDRLGLVTAEFGAWLESSPIECVRESGIRIQSDKMVNIEAVCCSYWTWSREAADVKAAKVESILTGIGPADHAWDNLVARLLEKEYGERSAWSRLITYQAPSWIEHAIVGSDISRIVAAMCSNTLANGLVSGERGVNLRVADDKGTGRTLITSDCTDAQFYLSLANYNLGRNVGLAPSSGLGQVCKVGSMVDWSRSLSGLALELANTDQWLGPNLTNRDKVALMAWWLSFLDQFPEKREVISGFLDLFCQSWFGCRLDSYTEGEIRAYSSISRHDGGLGAGEVVFHGKIRDPDSWTPGAGGIESSGVKREVEYDHCDMGIVECAVDEDTFERTGFWSATSLVKIGPLMSMLLRCDTRNEHRNVAGSLEMLVIDRIKRDNKPPPLKLCADEVEEPEDD